MFEPLMTGKGTNASLSQGVDCGINAWRDMSREPNYAPPGKDNDSWINFDEY